MTDVVEAAKILKALGNDGEPLRCVEADPSEVQRKQLKTLRKAVPSAIGSFIMGVLEYPRRKQRVILDAVYAARATLYAANADSKFFRSGSGSADGQPSAGNSVLNRRATSDGVGARVTQGTLAARRIGIEMLREFGLDVGDHEDLGGTRFEIEVVEAASQPEGGRKGAA